MRIAWFTPFHVRSAIGEFSRHVTRELATLADVEIWTSDGAPLLETEVPLVGYKSGSIELEALRGYDAIVYNMGNYLGYHAEIYAVSKEYPGIVILHDRALQHLFADMWLTGPDADPTYYIERMGAHYGREGTEVAQRSLRGERRPVWEVDEDLLRFPLYEEAIVNATGVITHSEGQARAIGERWLGPVSALRLPCYSNVLAGAVPEVSAPQDDALRLLTMGHLNPNKRVLEVIEALALRHDLAREVKYRVVGSDGGFVAYSASLRRAIEQNPHVNVEIADWLPDADLEREMQAADVFVNLRYPNIEGGSASLMKQLAYGRPVLCFDSGCFGELPEGVVERVRTGDFAAVMEALGALAADEARRRSIGARARQFAAACNERSYAEGVMALIDRSRKAVPALEFIDSVAGELGRMGADSRLPVFGEIASDFGRVLVL